MNLIFNYRSRSANLYYGFLLIMFSAFWVLPVCSQTNHVPNGNFETHSTTPTQRSVTPGNDQLRICGTGWRTVYRITTPDYFHRDNSNVCDINSNFNDDDAVSVSGPTIRNNLFGEQKPSSGKAYAGISFAIDTPGGARVSVSEYLMRDISELVAGREYIVSFKISLADGALYAMNNIGVLVTDSNTLSISNDSLLLNGRTPQAQSASVISNTQGWITVSGRFTAVSGMNCVVIGYFPNSSSVVSSTLGSSPNRGRYCYKTGKWSYYYIDDVRISEPACGCPFNDSTELVFNGSFTEPCDSVPTGYKSDLTYQDCGDYSSLHPGIAETDSASHWGPAWDGNDHTPGGGSHILVVDGPLVSAGNKRAWHQTINVVAGKRYCFSAWVKNICADNRTCFCEPTFQLRTGGLSGQLLDEFTGLNAILGWQKLSGTFTASATGTLELDIIILACGSANAGNDGAIDDISCIQIAPAPNASFNVDNPIRCNDSTAFTSAWDQADFMHTWTYTLDGQSHVSNEPNPQFWLFSNNLKSRTVIITHTVSNNCGTASVSKTIQLPDCRGCCDTAITTKLVLLNYTDSICCYNLVLEKSNCDLYGVRDVDIPYTGGIPLKQNKLQFPVVVGQLCAVSGHPYTTAVHFLGQNGDTVCTKYMEIGCGPCCHNNIKTRLEPLFFQDSVCCYNMILEESYCDLYGVRDSDIPFSGGIPLQQNKLQLPALVGRLCAREGEPYTTKVHFLGQHGDTVCSKKIQIGCGELETCCQSLHADINPAPLTSECACKFIINGWQDGSNNCPVYGVNVIKQNPSSMGTITPLTGITLFPLPLQSGFVPLAEICIPAVLSQSTVIYTGDIVVQFLDSNGNVICQKVVRWECQQGDEGNGGPDGGTTPGNNQQTDLTNTILPAMSLNCTPNPFTRESLISYILPAASDVTLSIYNVNGQMIEEIDSGHHNAGKQTVTYNNRKLAPGIYILNLRTSLGYQTIKIMVTAN